MTFQPKPSYLPEDLRDYAAPRTRMDLVWAALAAMLALVAYVQPVEPAIAESIEPAVDYSKMHTEAFVACMNEGGWAWKDPHTGEWWSVHCDRQKISRPM